MPDETPRRDRALGKTACIFLGGILLFASYAKLLEPGGFVNQIHLEGLDFWLPATSVAVVAIFLETCLGILRARASHQLAFRRFEPRRLA